MRMLMKGHIQVTDRVLWVHANEKPEPPSQWAPLQREQERERQRSKD